MSFKTTLLRAMKSAGECTINGYLLEVDMWRYSFNKLTIAVDLSEYDQGGYDFDPATIIEIDEYGCSKVKDTNSELPHDFYFQVTAAMTEKDLIK